VAQGTLSVADYPTSCSIAMAPFCDVNTTVDSLPSLVSLESTDSSDRTVTAATVGQGQTVVHTIEVLDPDVLSSLCRRGRRHLREIQASCQAMLRLDRMRGLLHVAGSPESIENVQKHLERLGGPSKEVSLAVWTELMRTRTTQDGPEAYLTQIQESSGCRVHIERHKQEVRLFGPRDAAALADKLLDEFSLCVDHRIVRVGDCMPTSTFLENIALDKRVTVQQDGHGIAIIGMHQHVQEAEAEIANHINAHAGATAQCSSTPAPRMPEVGLNQLTGKPPSLSHSEVAQGHAQAWTYPTSTSMPAVKTSVWQYQDSSSMSVPGQEDSHHPCQACPTCAAVRTCASCGNWCGWPADSTGGSTGVQHLPDGNPPPTYQYVQLIPYGALAGGSGSTNMSLVPVIMQQPGQMVQEGVSMQMVAQAPYMHTLKMPAYFVPLAGNSHETCGNSGPEHWIACA